MEPPKNNVGGLREMQQDEYDACKRQESTQMSPEPNFSAIFSWMAEFYNEDCCGDHQGNDRVVPQQVEAFGVSQDENLSTTVPQLASHVENSEDELDYSVIEYLRQVNDQPGNKNQSSIQINPGDQSSGLREMLQDEYDACERQGSKQMSSESHFSTFSSWMPEFLNDDCSGRTGSCLPASSTMKTQTFSLPEDQCRTANEKIKHLKLQMKFQKKRIAFLEHKAVYHAEKEASHKQKKEARENERNLCVAELGLIQRCLEELHQGQQPGMKTPEEVQEEYVVPVLCDPLLHQGSQMGQGSKGLLNVVSHKPKRVWNKKGEVTSARPKRSKPNRAGSISTEQRFMEVDEEDDDSVPDMDSLVARNSLRHDPKTGQVIVLETKGSKTENTIKPKEALEKRRKAYIENAKTEQSSWKTFISIAEKAQFVVSEILVCLEQAFDLRPENPWWTNAEDHLRKLYDSLFKATENPFHRGKDPFRRNNTGGGMQPWVNTPRQANNRVCNQKKYERIKNECERLLQVTKECKKSFRTQMNSLKDQFRRCSEGLQSSQLPHDVLEKLSGYAHWLEKKLEQLSEHVESAIFIE